MKAAVVFCLFAASLAPAYAEDCSFVSTGGDRATYDNPMTITIKGVDNEVVATCDTFSGGTGVGTRGVQCDDGYDGSVFTAPSTLGGTDQDLLIFHNDVWYLRCS